MFTLYTIFVVIGVIVLGLSLIGLDHEFDLDIDVDAGGGNPGADSPGIFSVRSIAVFLLTFGIGGILAANAGVVVWLQVLTGIAVGLAGVGFVFGIFKLMYAMQGSAQVKPENLIGKKGVVVTSAKEGSGKSMVRIETDGGSKEYLCKETESLLLEAGETVEVEDYFGGVLVVAKQALPKKSRKKK